MFKDLCFVGLLGDRNKRLCIDNANRVSKRSVNPATVAITHKQMLCGAERGRAFHVHSQRPHRAQEMQLHLRLTRMRRG